MSTGMQQAMSLVFNFHSESSQLNNRQSKHSHRVSLVHEGQVPFICYVGQCEQHPSLPGLPQF